MRLPNELRMAKFGIKDKICLICLSTCITNKNDLILQYVGHFFNIKNIYTFWQKESSPGLQTKNRIKKYILPSWNNKVITVKVYALTSYKVITWDFNSICNVSIPNCFWGSKQNTWDLNMKPVIVIFSYKDKGEICRCNRYRWQKPNSAKIALFCRRTGIFQCMFFFSLTGNEK